MREKWPTEEEYLRVLHTDSIVHALHYYYRNGDVTELEYLKAAVVVLSEMKQTLIKAEMDRVFREPFSKVFSYPPPSGTP